MNLNVLRPELMNGQLTAQRKVTVNLLAADGTVVATMEVPLDDKAFKQRLPALSGQLIPQAAVESPAAPALAANKLFTELVAKLAATVPWPNRPGTPDLPRVVQTLAVADSVSDAARKLNLSAAKLRYYVTKLGKPLNQKDPGVIHKAIKKIATGA